MNSLAGPDRTPPLATKASPLLERLRREAIARGDAQTTAAVLVSWARAFILFHNKQHPSALGLPAVTHFLEHVVRTAPGKRKGVRNLFRAEMGEKVPDTFFDQC